MHERVSSGENPVDLIGEQSHRTEALKWRFSRDHREWRQRQAKSWQDQKRNALTSCLDDCVRKRCQAIRQMIGQLEQKPVVTDYGNTDQLKPAEEVTSSVDEYLESLRQLEYERAKLGRFLSEINQSFSYDGVERRRAQFLLPGEGSELNQQVRALNSFCTREISGLHSTVSNWVQITRNALNRDGEGYSLSNLRGIAELLIVPTMKQEQDIFRLSGLSNDFRVIRHPVMFIMLIVVVSVVFRHTNTVYREGNIFAQAHRAPRANKTREARSVSPANHDYR